MAVQRLLRDAAEADGWELQIEITQRLLNYLTMRPRFVWANLRFAMTASTKLLEFRDQGFSNQLGLCEVMRTLFPSAPELHLCTTFNPIYIGREPEAP